MPRTPALIPVFLLFLCANPGRATTEAEAERLYQTRHYVEAQAAFEQLIAATPDNAGAAYHLGNLALMRNAPEEAAKWFEKATALAPRSSQYFRSLGDAYGMTAQQKTGLLSRLGLARKCHAAYERAVELAPDDVDARYSLFTFFRQAPGIAGGSLDKARAEALEIQKRDGLRGALALVELDVGEKRFEEAFAALDSIRRSHPESSVANYQFGRAAAMSGKRLEEGAATLRQYLATTPDETQPPLWAARWRLGQILVKQGDIPGARTEFAAGLQMNPTQPQLVEAARNLK